MKDTNWLKETPMFLKLSLTENQHRCFYDSDKDINNGNFSEYTSS